MKHDGIGSRSDWWYRPRRGMVATTTALLVVLSVTGMVLVFVAMCNHVRTGIVASDPIDTAISYQRAGSFTQAAEAWDTAEMAGSDRALCLGEQAYCLYRASEFERALDTCNRMLLIESACGRAHYIRGLVFRRNNRVDEARVEFRLAALHGEQFAASELGSK